ncbi:hypothetical protein DNTS_004704 [Danionella cerebrum]|uniref:Uncharacterized protein n=1 Tax=Danionella cerebrum TaxID=2873325 RepID=A0A553QZ35_9TELE|nr:hypothetical protein DNTS_004704 [Danionella translucida]
MVLSAEVILLLISMYVNCSKLTQRQRNSSEVDEEEQSRAGLVLLTSALSHDLLIRSTAGTADRALIDLRRLLAHRHTLQGKEEMQESLCCRRDSARHTAGVTMINEPLAVNTILIIDRVVCIPLHCSDLWICCLAPYKAAGVDGRADRGKTIPARIPAVRDSSRRAALVSSHPDGSPGLTQYSPASIVRIRSGQRRNHVGENRKQARLWWLFKNQKEMRDGLWGVYTRNSRGSSTDADGHRRVFGIKDDFMKVHTRAEALEALLPAAVVNLRRTRAALHSYALLSEVEWSEVECTELHQVSV